MANFDEFVTDRAVKLADVEAHLAVSHNTERSLGRFWVSTTSGSTGRHLPLESR